ncbi:MAG: hypothetical protein Q7S77_00400 [Candidatus Staskawiczbacteria bacterium]|nr:hypothetical protein [Candidatus Staskawiczbacteria bacterium]
MPEEIALTYLQQGQRGIFAEVYFPRRIAAQGTIFTALEEGYDEAIVKRYLENNVDSLLQELPQHLEVFDPHWYNMLAKRRQTPNKEDALARIANYMSPFFGWSNYVVDGVWFNDDENSSDFGKSFEEATQIIRLMFRFTSQYAQEAIQFQCPDVLRVMVFWIINRQIRPADIPRWDKSELKKFLQEYKFTKRKQAFAQKYFELVAREIFKWMGDWFLFVFGYLVRNFAARLAQRGKPENVIWVTTFFNLTVNELVKAPLPPS